MFIHFQFQCFNAFLFYFVNCMEKIRGSNRSRPASVLIRQQNSMEFLDDLKVSISAAHTEREAKPRSRKAECLSSASKASADNSRDGAFAFIFTSFLQNSTSTSTSEGHPDVQLTRSICFNLIQFSGSALLLPGFRKSVSGCALPESLRSMCFWSFTPVLMVICISCIFICMFFGRFLAFTLRLVVCRLMGFLRRSAPSSSLSGKPSESSGDAIENPDTVVPDRRTLHGTTKSNLVLHIDTIDLNTVS